jgi:hypothetical protein
MDTTLRYAWQRAVVDAFMELRPERLPEKIEIAERTLAERLTDSQQPDPSEQSALRDALQALRVFLPASEAASEAKSRHAAR